MIGRSSPRSRRLSSDIAFGGAFQNALTNSSGRTEPASGLRAGERRQFAQLIRRLRSRGLTLLLVEHDVALVTSLSDRITVLDLGSVIAEGAPAEIREDPRVISAYLGSTEVTSP